MTQIISFQEEQAISKRVYIEKYADVWKEKARVLKVVELEEKLAREALIEACENSDYEGSGVSVKQIERKGAIEYTAIPELADVNTEKYRKAPVFYWQVKPSLVE